MVSLCKSTLSMGFFTCMILCILIRSGDVYASKVSCGTEYTVVTGDHLSGIAERAYNDSMAWRSIFKENQSLFPAGPSILVVGQRLAIPCLSISQNQQTSIDATMGEGSAETKDIHDSLSHSNRRNRAPDKEAIELLTAGDYAPFTDKNLPDGGLITEIVQKALANYDAGYHITWVNDWSSHLDPLLKRKKFDMGFPWFYPGCPNKKEIRCEFLFSQPVFELLISLFIQKEAGFDFLGDSDLFGKRLCRPAGYFTHDLERAGRNWLERDYIKLVRPQTVKECFELLLDGEVDGVAINDFTGRETIARLGLQGKVLAAARELSKEGLSVVIHKSHPRSTILLNLLNKGLNDLHQSGGYEKILNRHLLAHWEKVESSRPEAISVQQPAEFD